MEKIYSCAEVAERYGVKVTTVWEWIRIGKLAAIAIGGKRYRVKESDLNRFEETKRKEK